MQQVEDRNDKLEMFRGTAQKGLDPIYPLLEIHIKVWIQRHPQEMAEFLNYKKETRANMYNKTGSSESLNLRHSVSLPTGLYAVLNFLAPNFLGTQELTPESKKKRVKLFIEHFPVFQISEKY